MGAWERVRELLQRSVDELAGSHEDPEALMAAAIEEMERELAAARAQLDARGTGETGAAELVRARREEAEHLARRAQEATRDQLPAEAERLAAAARRASEDADRLEKARAGSPPQDTAGLRAAVDALEQALVDARTRKQALHDHLKEVRRHVDTRAPPRVSAHAPDEDPRRRTEEAFRRMERDHAVEERLAALKEKLRK